MDLPVIGAHCQLELCGSLDLLPIKCNGCLRLFCRHHIALSSHSCSSLERNHDSLEALAQRTAASKRERCAFNGCQKVTLESVIVDKTQPEYRVVASCPQCAQAFCAAHRHPSDHACTNVPSEPSPSERNPEAHALLNKHFPAPPPSSSSQVSPVLAKALPMDPKKRARIRAVELMKMRLHAMPVDPKDKTASVPPSQRIHLKVVLADAVGAAPSDRIFWLRKTISTGKALDLIAERFSVHVSDSKPAHLEKSSSEDGTSTRLRNDKLLSEQIDDGETVQLSITSS